MPAVHATLMPGEVARAKIMMPRQTNEIAKPPYRPAWRNQYERVTRVKPYAVRSPRVPFCQRIRWVQRSFQVGMTSVRVSHPFGHRQRQPRVFIASVISSSSVIDA